MSGSARTSPSHSYELRAASLRIARAASGPETLSILLFRVVALEFAAVALSAYATSFLYGAIVLRHLPIPRIYSGSAFLIALLVLFVSLGFRHYASLQTQPLHRFLWNGLGAAALAFSFLLSILFLLKATGHYSRATFFFQLVVVAVAILATRVVGHGRVRRAVAAKRIEARRAVLIGAAARHPDIVARLREAGVWIIRSVPFPDDAAGGSDATEITERGALQRLIEICRISKVDDIVILAAAAELQASARLADILSELPVSLHVIPVDAEALLGPAHLGELGSLVTIQLLRPPLTTFHRLMKRAFDLAAAAIGLALLAPFLGLAAIAVRLDSPGPVLFRQTRHGYNNDPIRVFKFRTMTAMEDGHAFRQARRDDPRVTRIGHFLRRTNIDELPQLFNVLLGEMSIVGPRPHPVALNKLFEQHLSPFSRRHNVKPGITGWAQVNGYRGQTDTLEKMQRRFECDLYYIDNWSFLLDMKIILMTLFSRSAYTNAF